MKRIITLFLLLTTMLPATAEDRLRASELRSLGVDMFTFQPIAYSHDGRLLAAFDKAPFEEKKEGRYFRLWLIPVTADARFGTVRKVELPIVSFEQGSFTPDDRGFVILSKARTTFTMVDVNTMEFRNFMEYQPGVPGFRAEPAVLWTNGGQLMVTGTPYDENRFVKGRYIATIDVSKEGPDAFTTGPEVQSLERRINGMRFVNYNRTDLGFFGHKINDQSILSVWEGGDTVKEFDRAVAYHGVWGSGSRLLFSALRGKDQHELAIYDADSGQKTVLEAGAKPYSYLFLSKDAGTAVACQMDNESGRMDVFYAREEDGNQVKPVPQFKNARVGWLRVSSHGKTLVLFNQLGMQVVNLE